jgi:hypothetical protein
MKFAKKVVLILSALTAASYPLATQACKARGYQQRYAHDDHRIGASSAEEDCSQDSFFPGGLSNNVDGRRTSNLRVGAHTLVEINQLKRSEVVARWEQRVGTDRRLQDVIDIPVYVHIIQNTEGTQGQVSAQQILDQIDKLNVAFVDKFSFTLESTDTSLNSSWFTALHYTPEELEMKTALRQGGTNALNIYTLEPSNGELAWVSCAAPYCVVSRALDSRRKRQYTRVYCHSPCCLPSNLYIFITLLQKGIKPGNCSGGSKPQQ